MKTLATCRSMRDRLRFSLPGASAGFTILELLVVLTLMAAMTGLALPQFARMFESGQRAFERRQVLDDLAALPYAAFAQQKGFTLLSLPGNPEETPLVLPEGWTLKVVGEQGIQYRSNGFCSGGALLLNNDDVAEEVSLAAPLCAPVAR